MSYASTRKDPVSMKLRVANMRTEDVQGRTKQLEEESKKMEDRLRELKLAMNREKEQREQRGGGHWKSGKEGSLNTHAKEVLNKGTKSKSANSSKSRKVKVLKDEPLVTSSKVKEKPQPGTLAFLAQRDNSKPGLRQNGPICGQCEIKTAAVTCQECSELYCSGCFTAFHLKGALAKHRSVPVSKIVTSTPRGGSTPSAPIQDVTGSGDHILPPPTKIIWEQQEALGTSRSRKVISPSHNKTGSSKSKAPANSLLDGEYNENEAAQSFQQALAEWRKENTDPSPIKPTVLTSSKESKQPSARPTQRPSNTVVSPVSTPRVNVDEGTSTVGGSTKPSTTYQPEFHSSELSYAEKLLLKRNRRSDIPSLIGQSLSQTREGVNATADNSKEDITEEVVSFDRILATVKQSLREPDLVERSSSNAATIVDIQEVSVEEMDDTVADTESSYIVSEDASSLSTQPNKVYPTVVPARTAFFHKSVVTPALLLPVSKPSSSLQITEVTDSVDTTGSDVTATHSLVGSVADTRKSSVVEDRKSVSRAASRAKPTVGQDGLTAKKSAVHSDRPASRADRPASRADRPASRTDRPASRANTSFHRSRRPRTAAEKAADTYGEGTLTKRPSSAMKGLLARYKDSENSVYANAASYMDGLGDFFTAGVKKVVQERTLTPRKEKPLSPGTPMKKHQMSNKIYSLSGKTWRPDSSLGNNVEDSVLIHTLEEASKNQMLLEKSDTNEDRVMAEQTVIKYSYSASRDYTSTTRGIESVTQPIIQSLAERLSSPVSESPVNMSRPGSRSHSYTPRRRQVPSKGQGDSVTPFPVRPPSARRESSQILANKITERSTTPHRAHTPIVVDGDDMTRYDDIILPLASQNDDDMNAMNDLELELASQTGRLTADGRVSQIVLEGDTEVEDNEIISRSRTTTPDTHRDIDRLRESMMDDFEETELLIMQDEAMRVSLL